MKPVFN